MASTDDETDSDFTDTSETPSTSGNTPAPPLPPTPAPKGTSHSSGAGLLDPTLSRTRRRKLDIINKLYSLGAQLDIDIPQIVVIGSQSAGKSSLIESISGITLPRSSGTCTRCPTECLLVRSDKQWECEVSIRYLTDASGHTLQAVRNVSFGPLIQEPADVEERIRRAQRAALNPDTNHRDFLENNPNVPQKNSLDFTMNCVSLDIRGPDVADLSFCDLPGLIASVADNGRVEDIENVKKLVESYISKPSCIVLLTVACESDFETQGAHRLAMQHDPDGERTIGVLTKPDRISPGEEGRWIKLIKNESSPLVNGWYCVKQPSSMELQEKLTFKESRRRCEEYFEKEPWSTLDMEHRNKLGTQALTLKLNEYLMTLISKRLPELRRELQKVLQRTKDELQKLPAPNFKDPVMEVMHIIGDFTDEMSRHAEGITYSISGSSETNGDNQFEAIRYAHDIFRRTMRSTAPDFRSFEHSAPRPLYSANGNAEPPFLISEEKEIFPFLCGPIYLTDVVTRVQRATTRELPGYYPFQVVQDLISCSTSRWEAPALTLVESIHWIVLEHHNKLIELYFGKHTAGGLRQAVSKIMQEYTQKCRDETVERVKWLLELEAHAFTLNQHYLDDYRVKFLQYYKDHGEWLPSQHAAEPWNPYQYGLEIMATVRGYFQVAYKRVVDTLPLAIDIELVRVKKRNVQDAISLGLGITGERARQRCERLLAEPSEVIKRREELRSRLERLTKAESELMDM